MGIISGGLGVVASIGGEAVSVGIFTVPASLIGILSLAGIGFGVDTLYASSKDPWYVDENYSNQDIWSYQGIYTPIGDIFGETECNVCLEAQYE